MMGYTPGGSPIFSGSFSTKRRKSGQPLFACSVDPQHKTTKNQAKMNGGVCVHCKSFLADSFPKEKDRNIYLKQIAVLQRKLEYLDSMKENE